MAPRRERWTIREIDERNLDTVSQRKVRSVSVINLESGELVAAQGRASRGIAMRSLDGSSPSTFAVSATGSALRRLNHGLPAARHVTHARPCLATVSSEQTREDSWRAIEVIAKMHNRRVESYLQRRRHRPWRNRGS